MCHIFHSQESHVLYASSSFFFIQKRLYNTVKESCCINNNSNIGNTSYLWLIPTILLIISTSDFVKFGGVFITDILGGWVVIGKRVYSIQSLSSNLHSWYKFRGCWANDRTAVLSGYFLNHSRMHLGYFVPWTLLWYKTGESELQYHMVYSSCHWPLSHIQRVQMQNLLRRKLLNCEFLL